MTATDDGDTPTIEPAKKDVIRIKTDLNPRMILLPAVGAATGLFVGQLLLIICLYSSSHDVI